MAVTSMAAMMRRRAAEQGDALALTVAHVDGEVSLTFSELDRQSEQVARRLVDAGIEIGDMVTISLPNSAEFIVTALGAIKAGATVQPISHVLPLAERRAIVELADSRMIVGVEPSDHPDRTCVLSLLDVSDQSDATLAERISPTWKATTSGGSSGRPKLIITTTPALIDETLQPDYLLPRQSVVLIPGPLFHTAPFTMSLLAILHGNHLILQHRFDASVTMRQIGQYRPEFVLLVPTMMHRIWRLDPAERDAVDMSSVKTVFHMASPCPEWLKRCWIDWLGAERIFELYGASDSPGNTVISGTEWLLHPGSVGTAHVGSVRVGDQDGLPIPIGEVGEIWMCPPEGRESRSLVVGGAARVADGWTSVGDLGWMDDDGYLYIADRRTDMVVTGGENVFTAEVEAALELHPGVRSSVVVGLPDNDLGQIVHAVVEVAPGVTESSLRDHLSAHLARYKTPRTYELVDHPLRDGAGKVRKSEIIDSALQAREARRRSGN